jgi:glycosyltransferase involved in cell wall biosynthesis
VVLNRSLATTIKLELIASMLRANAHDVEVLSQGEVVQNTGKFYGSFVETERFNPEIPVHYASVLPIKRLNALWSSLRTFQLFKARHRASPFELVIIWNLKLPQLLCADYAIHRMGLPVILEYEDDIFVSLAGGARKHSFGYLRYASRVLRGISGAMACSPRLLAQLSDAIPKLLLRGVIGNDLELAQKESEKKNWVLFSGSHHKQYGIPALISAWKQADLRDWELHLTGDGPETAALRELAENCAGIRFHGLVSRPELVRLMSSAKICINPHETSRTPGNVFAFKIVEYLAAGAHVITTPMGPIEKELEAGITYMPNNLPETIAATLRQVVKDGAYGRTAAERVLQSYGAGQVSRSLAGLIQLTIAQSPKNRLGARVSQPIAPQPCNTSSNSCGLVKP